MHQQQFFSMMNVAIVIQLFAFWQRKTQYLIHPSISNIESAELLTKN